MTRQKRLRSSLLGEGSEKLSRALGLKRQQRVRMTELCQVPQRDFASKVAGRKISRSTLNLLVDLTYWSEFDSSRLGALRALETLSINKSSIDVLNSCGVLGAGLSILSRAGKEKTLTTEGLEGVLEACSTIHNLLSTSDGTKEKFLKAPDALVNVLNLLRSPQPKVREAAVKLLESLCTYPPAQRQVVQHGGASFLFAQIPVSSDKLRFRVVCLLRVLCQNTQVKSKELFDETIVELMMGMLSAHDCGTSVSSTSSRGSVPKDLQLLSFDYFSKMCSDPHTTMELARLDTEEYLVTTLKDKSVPLESRGQILRALERMAMVKETRLKLLQADLLPSAISIVFNEIAMLVSRCHHHLGSSLSVVSRGGGSLSSASLGGSASLGSSKASWCSARSNGPSLAYSQESLDTAMNMARTALSMFVHIAKEGHCEDLLHAGVLAHVNSVPIGPGETIDPPLMRSVSTLAQLLACGVTSESGRMSLIAQGPLDVVQRCLFADDAVQRAHAISTLASLCMLRELQPLILRDEAIIDEVIIALVPGGGEVTSAAISVLLQASKVEEAKVPLVTSKQLIEQVVAVVQWLNDHESEWLRWTSCLREALELLEELSHVTQARPALLQCGGVGLLTKITKRSVVSDEETVMRNAAARVLRNTGYKHD
ncbi:unnamed protein product [Chrysoparadoxa australica]